MSDYNQAVAYSPANVAHVLNLEDAGKSWKLVLRNLFQLTNEDIGGAVAVIVGRCDGDLNDDPNGAYLGFRLVDDNTDPDGPALYAMAPTTANVEAIANARSNREAARYLTRIVEGSVTYQFATAVGGRWAVCTAGGYPISSGTTGAYIGWTPIDPAADGALPTSIVNCLLSRRNDGPVFVTGDVR